MPKLYITTMLALQVNPRQFRVLSVEGERPSNRVIALAGRRNSWVQRVSCLHIKGVDRAAAGLDFLRENGYLKKILVLKSHVPYEVQQA